MRRAEGGEKRGKRIEEKRMMEERAKAKTEERRES